MKIYTKTGDKGETGLFSGGRVSKASALIEAYGTVDELNSFLGVAYPEIKTTKIKESTRRIQHELFEIGANLATPLNAKGVKVNRDHDPATLRLENEIDEMEKELEPLKNFILPGGSKSAALLHLSRTVCRRAERNVAQLVHDQTASPSTMVFLNRLSDWLFVAARFENHAAKIADIPWNVASP